ncbi:MAG: hypothetical protein GY777_10540 [Candidatus Brocadiaceae bacterium]|nr:hypothetical protein [Candidatus Brocadiaceae bacterium]
MIDNASDEELTLARPRGGHNDGSSNSCTKKNLKDDTKNISLPDCWHLTI